MSNWFKAHHSFQDLSSFHLICHQIVIDLWQREFAYPSYVTWWDPRLHLKVFKNVWSFNKNLGQKKDKHCLFIFFQGNQAWPGLLDRDKLQKGLPSCCRCQRGLAALGDILVAGKTRGGLRRAWETFENDEHEFESVDGKALDWTPRNCIKGIETQEMLPCSSRLTGGDNCEDSSLRFSPHLVWIIFISISSTKGLSCNRLWSSSNFPLLKV